MQIFASTKNKSCVFCQMAVFFLIIVKFYLVKRLQQ